MKKIIAIIVSIIAILIGIFAIYTQIVPDELTLEEKINEKISAYYTDLEDSLVTLTSQDNVSDYLLTWAKNKKISSQKDEYNNVIFTINTSKKYKEVSPTVIICNYDSSDMDNSLDALTSALYISKNNEKTGKLYTIFHDISDANDISKINFSYFENNAKVILLSSSDESKVINKTACNSVYKFTSNVNYVKPTLNKTYKITIKGLPNQIIEDNKKTPNSIKILGELLATIKSNALIYELAAFDGGKTASTSPKKSSCTIVINENDESKILEKIDTSIEKLKFKYFTKYPDLEFTYKEVKKPKKVLSQKSLDKFVSSIYTLVDAEYYYDTNNEILSIAHIGHIDISDNMYTVLASATSLDSNSLLEIDETYETICSLSSIKYKKTSGTKAWELNTDSEFCQSFSKAYNDYTKKDLNFSESFKPRQAVQISDLTDENNIIDIDISNDSINDYTGCILQYLINLLPKEN